ncbi:zinc finger protein 84 isoform X2 [Manduca sexta]|nr:zinc finger protein 84 isoform X2 [Manduca sexta]
MRPHVCFECGKGFKRKEHLNIHFTIHTGYKTQECVICKKSFYRKDHLQKHMQTHNKLFMEQNIIPVSDQELEIKQELVDYDTEKLQVQDESEELCYVKIENSERPYLCLVCHKTYKRKDHLKIHSTTHMKKDKVCRECGKAFHREQQLLVHMNTHLNPFPKDPDEVEGEPIIYDDQGEMIADEMSYLVPRMIKSNSEIRNHECTICHKRFKRKQHLKVHGNVHMKEQMAEFTVWCSDCNEGFRTNPEFENHPCMSAHSEPVVKIENPCDMDYAEGDEEEVNPPQEAKKENKLPLEFVEVDLAPPEEPEYAMFHDECNLPVPQRVYVCKYCSKPFKRKDHYKIHLHIHTGIKSFFCPECGKGFYRKDHMQKHIQVHTKTKLKPKKTLPDLLRITNMTPKTEIKPEITIHAPSSAKLRVPLQIKVPYQMVMSTDSGEQCAVTINPTGCSSEMIHS